RNKNKALLILALAAIALTLAIVSCDDQPSTPPQPINLTNAQSLDEKYSAEAVTYCAGSADEYLRSVAKYDFKWDDVGLLETKFDHYLKQLAAPGVLVMVSDKAKLQNGFGAYQHVELLCNY